MKRHRVVLASSVVGLAVALAGCGGSSATGSNSGGAGKSHAKSVKIALFRNADAPVLDPEFKGFKEAFLKGSGLSADRVTWVKKNAHGSTNDCTTIARQLAGQDLDGIAVAGTTCIVAMAAQDKETPIFALGMGHPVDAGVAKTIDRPGANVTGTWRGKGNAGPVVKSTATVKPKPKSLGIIYASANQSTAVWVKNAEKAAKDEGIDTKVVGVTSTADITTAARSLAGKVDAFLLPPDGVIAAGLSGVASTATKADVPIYTSGLVVTKAVDGVVADYGKSYHQMGALGGDLAVDVIMHSADPSDTPFRAVKEYTWNINKAASKKFGITYPDDVKGSANFVQE